MVVSSSLAQTAPSVKFFAPFCIRPTHPGSRMQPSVENVNRVGTLVSEKVHLDEIAATLDRRPWSGLMERLDVACDKRPDRLPSRDGADISAATLSIPLSRINHGD
jgi:hypothetical protein